MAAKNFQQPDNRPQTEPSDVYSVDPEDNPYGPATVQEMVDSTVEIMKGEGEPIRNRAPLVPFLIVLMSYMAVLLVLATVVGLALWFFGTLRD